MADTSERRDFPQLPHARRRSTPELFGNSSHTNGTRDEGSSSSSSSSSIHQLHAGGFTADEGSSDVPSVVSPYSSASSSSKEAISLLQKAKRRFSEHKRPFISSSLKGLTEAVDKKLPSFGGSKGFGGAGGAGGAAVGGGEGGGSGRSDATPAVGPTLKTFSIAPPHHRENTALHALLDSLPTLPTLHTPSLPSFNFSTPSFSTPSISCLTADLSDDDDNDPQLHAMAGGDDGVDPNGTANGSVSTDPLKRLSGNVVVMGGYRGSILRDAKSGKRLWIPLRVGFGLRKPDLELGLSDEDEFRSTERVVPGRMLMAVGGVIDLGKRLKDKLKLLESVQSPSSSSSATSAPHSGSRPRPLKFHNWGYDWRRRLELSSAELVRFLENLKSESATKGEGHDGVGEGATVIAHSMGGLVALHALSQASDPTIFKGIIFAGTPFHGCVNVLGPLRYGDGVLFNREICSPSVVFSMRSSFYFLPENGRCFETPQGDILPCDFYDPATWSRLNLSPLAGDLFGSGGKDQEQRRNQMKREAEKATEQLGGLGSAVEPRIEATEGGVGVAPANSAIKMNANRKTSRRNSIISTGPLNGSTAADSASEGEEVDFHFESDVTAVRKGVATPSSTLSSAPSSPRRFRYSSPNGGGGVGGGGGGGGDVNFTERDDLPATGPSTGTTTPALQNQSSHSSDAVLAEYLARSLQRVKDFRREMIESYDETKAHLYPPLCILTSQKTATVRGVIMPSYDAIAETPYEHLLWGVGDGIVLYESARCFPGGEEGTWMKHLKGVEESTHGHVSLLGDLDGVRRCLEKLYN